MDREYSQLSSLEGMAARVTLLEESIGVGEDPLVVLEDTIELQDSLQDQVADAASGLMTGFRLSRERREYENAYREYRRLLGVVALDLASRTFEESGDIGEVKQGVFTYLEDSKRQMTIRDYEMRLEKSSVERSKQWLAHHRKTRLVLPLALSAMTTGALFKASEASSSFIDLTPTQGGIMGIMTLMGSVAIRSALRNGPRQAGAVLRDQFNASLRTYMIEGQVPKNGNGEPLDMSDLPEYYAERHLTLPLGAAAVYLTKCDVVGEDDFAPMIDELLSITEASMYESYGIVAEGASQMPWYRRKIDQVLPIDIPA